MLSPPSGKVHSMAGPCCTRIAASPVPGAIALGQRVLIFSLGTQPPSEGAYQHHLVLRIEVSAGIVELIGGNHQKRRLQVGDLRLRGSVGT
jgi:hypothetical protein